MKLRFVLRSALKDLKRRANDPLALVFWLGIPLLVGGLMSLVSGGPGQGPRGVVLLADEDDAIVGRLVESALSQGPLGSLFDIERVATAEGRTAMEAGSATALIVVPKGATDAVLDQTPLTLHLVTNPAQRILPGIVEETLELLVEASFYLQRLLGEPLRQFRDEQPDGDGFPLDLQVSTLAGTVNARLRGLRPLLFPPVLQVSVEQPAASADDLSTPMDFGRLFLPGLLFMSLLFIAQGMTADIWEEQVQGTLRRALSAPAGLTSFLLGKLVAGAVLMTAVTLVGLGVAVLLFGIAVARALVALPWVVFGGTVLLALFLVPQVAASSQRTANLLSSMMVFPLMMIGGSFFPFEAMPPWMAAVGRWTPNGQAVARLKDLLNGTATLVPFVVAAAAMLVPALLAFGWAGGRLRRRFEGGA